MGKHLPALAAPWVLTGFDAAGAPLEPGLATKPVTLRRLLTHTSGLAYDFCSADLTAWLSATGGSMFGAADPDIPLMFEPGEAWQYSMSASIGPAA